MRNLQTATKEKQKTENDKTWEKMQPQDPCPTRTGPEHNKIEKNGSQVLDLSEMRAAEVKKKWKRLQKKIIFQIRKEIMTKMKDTRVDSDIEGLKKMMETINAQHRRKMESTNQAQRSTQENKNATVV